MARRTRLRNGFSVIAITGALAIAGCSGGETEDENPGADVEGVAVEAEQVSLSLPGSDKPAGASESEIDVEPEILDERDAASVMNDRVGYFARLMLISGHLRAGVEAYEFGEPGFALENLKHPEDEIYLDLAPAFKTYDAPRFDDQLIYLYESVKEGAPKETVEARLIEVDAAIGRAADAAAPTVKELLLAASFVLRKAGEEFDLAVKMYEVVGVGEYQAAYGYMSVVSDILGDLRSEDESAWEAITVARNQAMMALEMVPSAAPPMKVKASSAPIYGAAERIEMAALQLK